jgi:hypothetical protein
MLQWHNSPTPASERTPLWASDTKFRALILSYSQHVQFANTYASTHILVLLTAAFLVLERVFTIDKDNNIVEPGFLHSLFDAGVRFWSDQQKTQIIFRTRDCLSCAPILGYASMTSQKEWRGLLTRQTWNIDEKVGVHTPLWSALSQARAIARSSLCNVVMLLYYYHHTRMIVMSPRTYVIVNDPAMDGRLSTNGIVEYWSLDTSRCNERGFYDPRGFACIARHTTMEMLFHHLLVALGIFTTKDSIPSLTETKPATSYDDLTDLNSYELTAFWKIKKTN